MQINFIPFYIFTYSLFLLFFFVVVFFVFSVVFSAVFFVVFFVVFFLVSLPFAMIAMVSSNVNLSASCPFGIL